jgi:glycosyltransferase involved in cell wall biosynthesis
MSPLRVCIVAGSYPPALCGVGDYTELLSTALASSGVEVSVITSAYLGTPYRSGNPTVLPIVKEWSLATAGRILWNILRTRPDIVHFQFPTTEYHSHRVFDLLVPMVALWPKSIKTVLTLHEYSSVKKSLIPGLFRPLRTWLSCTGTDAIIVVAESYRDLIRDFSSRMRRIPFKVIPIASNIPVFQMSLEQLQKLRQQTGIAEKEIVLSYFGFIHPSKGFEQVLEVLKVLRNQGIPAKLIVLGELSNANSYHQRLRALITQKPFADSVKVMGHLNRDEVANCLAMSDACVLPFVDGLHPKRGSFLAAVQQGVLTVTTSVEKSGMFLDENVFYAKPGDIEEMAKAVCRYSARRVPAGVHPRRTWGSVADEHLEFFNQLLGGEKANLSLQAAARDTNGCR